MKWVADAPDRDLRLSRGPRACGERACPPHSPRPHRGGVSSARRPGGTSFRLRLVRGARRVRRGRNYNVKDVSRAWPYGAWVSLYMRRCARRIAEMAPRSPLALPSRPDRQGSVQLHAPARGIAITPPHHFTKSTNPYSRPRALTRDAQARRCPRANQPRAPAR